MCIRDSLAFNVLCSKSAFCKCRAHLILGVGRKFCPDFINTGCLVVALYFLLKISNPVSYTHLDVYKRQVLVVGSPVFPSKNNFVKALRKEHPEISTIVLNINDKKTSMVLGEREIVIYGKGFIRDRLCGCSFRISPK